MARATTPRRRGRILTSLLLLLFGVGVVPLLATSWKLVSQSREILELDQKTLQLDKARSLSQQVGIYVGSLRSQVVSIARTLEVDTDAASFPARVARIRDSQALARYLGSSGNLNSLSVVDSSGAGAWAGVRLPEAAVEQQLREGFERAMRREALLSHPVYSASLQEPVIVIGEPVVPPGSATAQGAVVAVGSLAALWGMTQKMGQGGQVDVYVIDGRNHLVAHSDPRRLQGRLDFSDVEIVQVFRESRGASATLPFTLVTDHGPARMLGTYAAVPETEWGVIVQVEVDKAYHQANEMMKYSLGLVLIVTLLAVVLGSLFADQISSPVRELVRGALRLAGGDYASRVAVRANNEVAVLGEAFNTMGEEIQKAIEEVRQAAAKNKELFIGSIRMLANAIDEKDPYTRGHSERVSFYSLLMAKHMGWSEEEVERVQLCGIIHDVGKIGIEDKILRKPSALTEEEYAIMKQHPKKGEHILAAVPLLSQLAAPGLQHHENWDGSGYPDGLREEQIPQIGRIVCVADAFDAMTTDRPYSKAMTFEAALTRLRFLSGKKFDPAAVEAIEKAFAVGDLTPAKARRAAAAARGENLSDLEEPEEEVGAHRPA